jgi:uncharacterized protein YegP (UPF0339 family)
MKIEVFPRRTKHGRRYFFRIRATNGQIVAQSCAGDGHSNREDCIMSAGHLRANLIEASIVDETGAEIG